jgi:hypothetical protein
MHHHRHVSYFLSPVTRPHFRAGHLDLVAERIPNGATIQTGIGAIPTVIVESVQSCCRTASSTRTPFVT